jgi:hypothetical protein
MLRATVVFLVLVAAYPISYLVLLDPEVEAFTYAGFTSGKTKFSRNISFRFFGESEDFLQVAYKPLIALDVQWRPKYWSWDVLPDR